MSEFVKYIRKKEKEEIRVKNKCKSARRFKFEIDSIVESTVVCLGLIYEDIKFHRNSKGYKIIIPRVKSPSVYMVGYVFSLGHHYHDDRAIRLNIENNKVVISKKLTGFSPFGYPTSSNNKIEKLLRFKQKYYKMKIDYKVFKGIETFILEGQKSNFNMSVIKEVIMLFSEDLMED